MGRWTQQDEDSSRLPEGVTRIGYDADTQRYTFQDNNTGTIYQGEPRAEYGVMNPVSSPPSESAKNVVSDSAGRKDMWGKPGRNTTRNLSVDLSTSPPPKTFSDILPAELITCPSSAKSNTDPPLSDSHERSSDRLRRVVRSKTLPKMQGVVQNAMRRSRTVRIRKRDSKEEDTKSMMSKRGLLEGDGESFVSDTESRL